MTCGNLPLDCSGWLLFWRHLSENARLLQSLKSPLDRLGCRVDVAQRDHDAAVTRDAHDRECIHSRFPQPSQHCMASGVVHEIDREKWSALFLTNRANAFRWRWLNRSEKTENAGEAFRSSILTSHLPGRFALPPQSGVPCEGSPALCCAGCALR